MTTQLRSHGLVGREEALAALRTAFSATVSGRSRPVLLAGEAGIGKTALAAALAEQLTAEGGLVLWGHCWDGTGAPAYWPWAQVLRAGTAAGASPGPAARLLPESDDTASSSGDGAAEQQFELFDAMSRHLRELADQRPVAVVLDDLQWADAASLAMAEFCARHLQSARVLLVGTYRDDEMTPALRRLAASGRVVPLTGLSAPQVTELVAALVGARVDPRLGEVVWSRTGGNPLFVGEVLRLLAASGDLDEAAATQVAVPDSVREVLDRRLARLSQPCADLLSVAAVAGPQLSVDVLGPLVDDRARVEDLLSEAVAAGVLLPPTTAVGPHRFSHDLFRQTVLHTMPAEARRALHLRVARVLEDLRDQGAPVHPAELAAHFGFAVAQAPAETLRYSVLAAVAAQARLAFSDACDHYQRALAASVIGSESQPGLRVGLLLDLGAAAAHAGDAPRALAAYQDAARLAEEHADAAGLARAALGVHALGWRQSHALSISLLEQALSALPAAPSVQRARVLAGLARDLHHSTHEQDWDRAQVLADRAVADARALDDPATEAFCLLALHDAHWRPGTAERRLEVLDQMLAAARVAGDRDLVAQSRLLRAAARIELGDPRGAVDLESYCRLSEELGHAQGRYGAQSRRATVALLAGRLEEARRLSQEAAELGQAIGEPDTAGVRETLLWAVQRVGSSTNPPPPLESEPWPLPVALADAVVHVARGEVETARGLLAGLRVEALPRTHDLELLAFTAAAVAAAGSPAQQAELYDLMAPHAGRHVVVGGCASYYGAVDHHLGLLARALGRGADARRHLAAALALHERLGAAAWLERSRAEVAACAAVAVGADATFRRRDGIWQLVYRGREEHLPDAKGLRDLAVLLSRPGEPVSAVELHTGTVRHVGADAVLDSRAKTAYRRRLVELEAEFDDAAAGADPRRVERARAERTALVAELTAASGLAGRDRRLGDESERARKAVAARIGAAVRRIERTHPALATHLHHAVSTGTWCTYSPPEPVRWRL